MSLPEAVNGGGVSMDQCGGLARGAGGQHGSSHSAVPPPPFVIKTYEMVDDRMTDAIVSWGPACNTFVVWDLYEFSRRLLPKFFKHSNFSSFVRQLNTYGFRKVNPDRWEFAHEEFVKGQQLRFKNIHRRKPAGVCGPATNPCFASAQQQQTSPQAPQGRATHPLDELERLRKDKVMMMMELGRLGTEYYYAQQEIRAIAERLQATEAHQQQITAFFARTMCPPALLREFQDQNAGEDTKMTTTTTLQQRISHSDAMGRKRARCMASDVAPAADDASGLHRDRRSPSCENEDHPSVSTDDGGGGHHHPKLLEINLNVDAAASMCSPELASMDAADSSSLCAAAYDANKQQLLQQQQPLSPTDLNHPLSSTGEWDWQEGQSGHGFEHHGTINHTYFDGMESELFWEHLLGPSTHSVTQQTDHSEMRLVDQLRWPAL